MTIISHLCFKTLTHILKPFSKGYQSEEAADYIESSLLFEQNIGDSGKRKFLLTGGNVIRTRFK